MTLQSCDECGHDVSTKAATCPNCGAPVVHEPGETVSTVDHGQTYCAIKHEKIARSRRHAAQPCPHCDVPLPPYGTAVRIGLDANGTVVSLTTLKPSPIVGWSKRTASPIGDRDRDLLPRADGATSGRLGSPRIRRNVVIAVVIGIVFVAAGLINESSLSGGSSTNRYVDEYGGIESVYDRISLTSDCGTLQSDFDRAADNNERSEPGTVAHTATLGYMRAADDRMEQVGCYG